MSIKEKVMNQMMENQFQNMSAEDKKKMMETMMEKFMSSMSDEERKEMMSSMMPKMMGQMMEGNPMMGMMSMMMGGKKPGQSGKNTGNSKMPWDMCCDMMTGVKETANTAKFATEELRGLFDEWCQQIENEILDHIKETKSIIIDELVDKFSLAEESVRYLLNRLANKNLIDFKV